MSSRTINKIISKEVMVQNDFVATLEKIEVINEDIPSRSISVTISYNDTEGEEISKEDFLVTGDIYDLFIAQPLPHDSTKTLKENYVENIWYVIDTIRNE